jgi:hypothetical protein
LDDPSGQAAPLEYVVGRVCQEFPCFSPAEALEALEQDAGGLIFRIMEYRSYASAYELHESTKTMDFAKRPKGAMLDLVRANGFLIAGEAIKAHEESA